MVCNWVHKRPCGFSAVRSRAAEFSRNVGSIWGVGVCCDASAVSFWVDKRVLRICFSMKRSFGILTELSIGEDSKDLWKKEHAVIRLVGPGVTQIRREQETIH